MVIFSAYAVFHLSHIKEVSIEKIYVINLDRSVDRYASVQKLLDSTELPVAYSRFSAVDGKKMQISNLETGEIFTGEEILPKKIFLNGKFVTNCASDDNKYFISFTIKEKKHRPRLVGEIGVSCSHKKIWQEIIEKNYKNTLILEDDFHFIENFTDRLDRATNNAPKDSNLLYLAYGNLGQAYTNPAKNAVLRIILSFFDQRIKNPFWKQARRNIGSMQGYILSETGAKQLLKCEKQFFAEEFVPIDIVMSKCIESQQITTYVSKPALVLSDPKIPSDIGLW